MGGIFTCAASEMACCLGGSACSCCLKGFSCFASTATRAAYALLFLVGSVVAYLFRTDWVNESVLSKVPYLNLHCPDGVCNGTMAVYRVCFSLMLFHAGLSLLTIGIDSSKNFRAGIHNGFWLPKLLVLILLSVLCFTVTPNSFYAHPVLLGIFYCGATAFILIQLLYLVDFAHGFSEYCLDRYDGAFSGSDEESARKWLYILVGSCLLMFCGVIALTALLYVVNAWSADCGLNQFFVTYNLIMAFVISLISIHPRIQEFNPVSGLPQASLVALYATYLVYSAISNSPYDPICNPYYSNSTSNSTSSNFNSNFNSNSNFNFNSNSTIPSSSIPSNTSRESASAIFGAIFTFVSVIYSTTRAASRSSLEKGGFFALESGTSGPEDGASDLEDSKHPVDDESESCVYSYSFFHFIYLTGIMYMAMLITDWNSVTETNNQIIIGKGWTSMWVKVISSWIVSFMYIWTLVAPIFYPDREFT